MAYNSGYGRPGGQYNRPQGQSRPGPQPVKPEPLPEDYARAAEAAIASLRGDDRRVITTTKLRSLFSLFADLYNEVARTDRDKLSKDQVNELSAAKVRIYYEIGREDRYKGNPEEVPVGLFVVRSKLLEYLMDIGDSGEKLVRFYHYMEALVAFHRFYFGEKKDKR